MTAVVPDPVRVLLVDDDALMRAGLAAVLSSDDDVLVVGEAEDGAVALERVRQHEPEVVLMDVRMPGVDGIAATREIVAAAPEARVVILTTFEDDEYIFGALTAGASGFLLKRASSSSGLARLRRKPDAPAVSAPKMYSSSSNVVLSLIHI